MDLVLFLRGHWLFPFPVVLWWPGLLQPLSAKKKEENGFTASSQVPCPVLNCSIQGYFWEDTGCAKLGRMTQEAAVV